jgi:hypothetical protein
VLEFVILDELRFNATFTVPPKPGKVKKKTPEERPDQRRSHLVKPNAEGMTQN